MRLAFLTPLWPSRDPDSGIATYMACEARALAARGHDVEVLFLNPHLRADEPVRTYVEHGVCLREIPTGRTGRGGFLLRRLLAPWRAWSVLRARRGALDGIITNSYEFPGLAYAWCGGGTPILTRVSTTMATVGELSGNSASLSFAVSAWLEKLAVRASTLLCSHTRAHIDFCARQFGVPADRFFLIPHGIEIPAMPPEERWCDPPVVLFVGRLGRRKGTDVLLAAARRVLAAHPDCRFELIGSDEERLGEWFAAEYAEYAPRISFLGRLGNAERDAALERCYLFVSPSPYESFGLTFLEAMNFGKPVICCSGSGAAEMIGDAGLAVPPGDADALAVAILAMLAEPDRRCRLGQQAARRAGEFSVEKTARQIEEVFTNFGARR